MRVIFGGYAMDEQNKDSAAEIRALIAQLEGETDPECIWVVRLLKEALADIERKQMLRSQGLYFH